MPSHMLAAGVCVCVMYHNTCARRSNQLCANIHIYLAPKSG